MLFRSLDNTDSETIATIKWSVADVSNGSPVKALQELNTPSTANPAPILDLLVLEMPELRNFDIRPLFRYVQALKASGRVRSVAVRGAADVLSAALVNLPIDAVCVPDALLPSPQARDAFALAQHLHREVLVTGQIPDERGPTDELAAVVTQSRCAWASDPLLAYYHDFEWGHLPETDERWFEFVVLETFQAGLSWKTILNKRLSFRQAFDCFELESVSQYDDEDVVRLLQDSGIVRNRKKIVAAVENAVIARDLAENHGSFNAFMRQLPETGDVLKALQSTFRFVGRTTAESIAYATGLIPPPHDADCMASRGNG